MRERAHPSRVGNDIVDLGDCESLPRARFVERVCTPSELCLLASGDVQLFWSLFAAKEAAFKALKKLLPSLPFVPRKFAVSPELDTVHHAGHRLGLSIFVTEQWVHALAHTGGARPSFRVGAIRPGESESEGARRVLRELGESEQRCPGEALVVARQADPDSWDGRGIPHAYAAGRLLPLDVSLSHDGRFAAGALSAEEVWVK